MVGFFVSLVGSGCHFAYHALDCSWVVGWLVAVNESLFEHLKLLIFPLLLWWTLIVPIASAWILQEGPQKDPARTFITHTAAVSIGIICGTLCTTVVYLIFSYVLEFDALWFDIMTFIFSAFVAQYVGWCVFCECNWRWDYYFLQMKYRILVVVVFVGLVCMYLTLTDFPPREGIVAELIFSDTSSKNSTAEWFYGRPSVC